MTLVVAEVESDRITAVCDTLSYYEGEPRKTQAKAYVDSRPKLAILREDLVVGVAGDDFQRTLQTVAGMRGLSADRLVEQALALTAPDPFGRKREILVAALDPARVWQLKDGAAVAAHDTPHRRAWLGDRDAFNRFCGLEAPPSDAGLGLQAPMQSLTYVGGSPVVGGITLRVDTCEHGFGYQATPASLFEPADDATLSYDGNCLTIKASFTAAPLNIAVLTGRDPTRGALAIHFCGGKLGYLYPLERPWERHTLRADSCSELVNMAAEQGQSLGVQSSCPAGGNFSPAD